MGLQGDSAVGHSRKRALRGHSGVGHFQETLGLGTPGRFWGGALGLGSPGTVSGWALQLWGWALQETLELGTL